MSQMQTQYVSVEDKKIIINYKAINSAIDIIFRQRVKESINKYIEEIEKVCISSVDLLFPAVIFNLSSVPQENIDLFISKLIEENINFRFKYAYFENSVLFGQYNGGGYYNVVSKDSINAASDLFLTYKEVKNLIQESAFENKTQGRRLMLQLVVIFDNE
jgi:hypothetical protein